MAGYETVVNAMHPVTPKAVRTRKTRPRTSARGSAPVEKRRRAARPGLPPAFADRNRRHREAAAEEITPSPVRRRRSQTVSEQLVSFALGEMTAVEIAVFVRLLEARHGKESPEASVGDRLGAVVYRRVPPEDALTYLEELRRRRLQGEPLIKPEHTDE
jgi:hypothetical protein